MDHTVLARAINPAREERPEPALPPPIPDMQPGDRQIFAPAFPLEILINEASGTSRRVSLARGQHHVVPRGIPFAVIRQALTHGVIVRGTPNDGFTLRQYEDPTTKLIFQVTVPEASVPRVVDQDGGRAHFEALRRHKEARDRVSRLQRDRADLDAAIAAADQELAQAARALEELRAAAA